jgi:hypothetical protein
LFELRAVLASLLAFLSSRSTTRPCGIAFVRSLRAGDSYDALRVRFRTFRWIGTLRMIGILSGIGFGITSISLIAISNCTLRLSYAS